MPSTGVEKKKPPADEHHNAKRRKKKEVSKRRRGVVCFLKREGKSEPTLGVKRKGRGCPYLHRERKIREGRGEFLSCSGDNKKNFLQKREKEVSEKREKTTLMTPGRERVFIVLTGKKKVKIDTLIVEFAHHRKGIVIEKRNLTTEGVSRNFFNTA